MIHARSTRLWVIDPSQNHAEDEGVAEILQGWPGESRLFRPALCPGDGPGPSTGHDADGIVLMGSAASVEDELPWLVDLAAWLRPVIDGTNEIPLLGICFGHQLIAHCAGARVGFLNDERTKRVGIEETEVRNSRLVDGQRRLRVVVSHREIVCERPDGYSVTASRDGVEFDGIEHESRPIFAYQFHPEARGDFARSAGFDAALVDDRVREDSRLVLDGFVRAVTQFS